MRTVRWSPLARADLVRLTKFLAAGSPRAADRAAAHLKIRVSQLKEHPRLGARVPGYEPRDVRRLIASPYEVQYELTAQTMTIVRVFHTREGR